MVLEELEIPYETKFLDFKQVKEEEFTSLNPNGRVPGIKDPNQNNITLWEVSLPSQCYTVFFAPLPQLPIPNHAPCHETK